MIAPATPLCADFIGEDPRNRRFSTVAADLFSTGVVSQPAKRHNTVPTLSRAIADYIVREALAAQLSLSRSKIEPHLSVDSLSLDPAAMRRVQEQIVRTVESIGFSTKFSVDAFSDAQTVGDLTDLLLAATDDGWPG